jgi:DNA-binding transcriptional LysR family regulator
MDLNALRDFVTVVREGSFTAAARRLKTPKSTISARIAALEASLGARLLERTTRSLRLTNEGTAFFERAAAAVAEAQEAERVIRDRDAVPTGHLRVSAPYLFGEVALPAVAVNYAALYPQATVDIVLSDRRVNLVEEGFDLAIRVGSSKDSSLVSRLIATTRQRWVVAPALAAALTHLREPESLKSVPCILFDSGGSMRQPMTWRYRQGAKTGAVRVDGPLAMNSLIAIRKAALAGAGVAALPEFLVGSDLKNGTLVSVLDDWTGTTFEIRAVFPSLRLLNARTRAFIDLLVAAMDETDDVSP